MSVIVDVSCLMYALGQYFLQRMGLRHKPPEVQKYYVHGLHALDAIFGWSKKTRVRGARHCPRSGPAVFASNHIEIDDPFIAGVAIHEISGGIRPGGMMRDDFFRGIPRWLRRVFDPDEVACLIGGAQISRQGATPEQIEQFIQMLLDRRAFLIYPGRSRTRTGVFFEYREWIRSPGRTSLFPAQVRKREPGLSVPVVPIARTYNMATRRSCLAFGPHLLLEPGAGPDRQREFDYQIVCAISELIEVNAAQILSALIYLRCLHGLSTRAGSDDLTDAVRDVAAAIASENPHRMIDPALMAEPERELDRVLRFLHKRSIIRRKGRQVELNSSAVLSVPESYGKYRIANPVKFLANQLIHLPDVIGPIEDRILGRPAVRRTARAVASR